MFNLAVVLAASLSSGAEWRYQHNFTNPMGLPSKYAYHGGSKAMGRADCLAACEHERGCAAAVFHGTDDHCHLFLGALGAADFNASLAADPDRDACLVSAGPAPPPTPPAPTPPTPTPTPPMPPPAPTPSCTCDSGAPCDLDGIVEFSGCWEYGPGRAQQRQDCSAICSGWAARRPADVRGAKLPDASVSTQATTAWSGGAPGALMLATGNGTHMTMAYFNSNPTGASKAAVLAAAVALADTAAWREVSVRAELYAMWGCGPSCNAASALVDVASPLAQLKNTLMASFEAQGFDLDKTSWGATAHIALIGSQ